MEGIRGIHTNTVCSSGRDSWHWKGNLKWWDTKERGKRRPEAGARFNSPATATLTTSGEQMPHYLQLSTVILLKIGAQRYFPLVSLKGYSTDLAILQV